MAKEEDKDNNLLRTIKSIEGGSGKVISWCLSLLGGSLLTILSSSYNHPEGYLKYFYLLFILAWAFLFLSIYYGMNISNRLMAAELFSNKNSALEDIFGKINFDYANQLKFFKWSLVVFALWLLFYISWWIFLI